MNGKRLAKTLSSLALGLAATGCLSTYEVPIETPTQSKIDVSAFQRVLVAGFVSGGSRAVDTNAETTRLLKSQLRTKSDLKVVDTDVLQLVAEVDKRREAAGDPPIPDPKSPTELKIKDAQDLQAYEAIFNDAAYWRRIGDEYQSPLIVTGTILFVETAKSGVQSTVQPTQDAQGRTSYTEVRQMVDKKGFTLVPKFIFIDGRTGTQLYSETYNQEVMYNSTQNTPPLSSYFELMDKLLPGFLNTLSNQKIKGTRILIK
jgi:hypothetical protein